MDKIPVAIVGATGMVGQRFISQLINHPKFFISEIASSSKTAGQYYGDVVSWKLNTPLPDSIKNMRLLKGGDPLQSQIIFSSMPASPAVKIEKKYATEGHYVISNSSAYRMDTKVPLVIPEVNPDHILMVRKQGTSGGIITNCNCAAMFLSLVIAPLHYNFTVTSVQATTLQAVSGAGYPGVSSLDILGNVIPLPEEELKIEKEIKKILGSIEKNSFVPAKFPVSAQCHRVPVIDGHTETLSIGLSDSPTNSQISEILKSFQGLPQKASFYSAPQQPIIVLEDPERPQPRLDVNTMNGMVALVGRIRPCSVLTFKMIVLGHNLLRGAASAAILNAETLIHYGIIS